MPTQEINRGDDRLPVVIVWDEDHPPTEYVRCEPAIVVTPYNGGVDIETDERSIYIGRQMMRQLAKVFRDIEKQWAAADPE